MMSNKGEEFYADLEMRVNGAISQAKVPVQDLVLALQMVLHTVILEEMTRREENNNLEN